jgi:hypothetical protein
LKIPAIGTPVKVPGNGVSTDFGKSTNFGTFTKVPIASILTDFGIGTKV